MYEFKIYKGLFKVNYDRLQFPTDLKLNTWLGKFKSLLPVIQLTVKLHSQLHVSYSFQQNVFTVSKILRLFRSVFGILIHKTPADFGSALGQELLSVSLLLLFTFFISSFIFKYCFIRFMLQKYSIRFSKRFLTLFLFEKQQRKREMERNKER